MVLDWCWGGDKAIPLRMCWVRSNKNQVCEWGFLGSYQISYRMTVLWEWRFQGSVRSVLPASAISKLLLIARLLHFKITVGMGIRQVNTAHGFLFLQRFSHFSWGNKKNWIVTSLCLMSRITKKLILTIFASTYCFYKEVSLGGFPPRFGSVFPDFLKNLFFTSNYIETCPGEKQKISTSLCLSSPSSLLFSFNHNSYVKKVTWFSDTSSNPLTLKKERGLKC